MAIYRNLQGKNFMEPESGSWYNLESGRKITKRPKGRSDYILNESPRIAGTSEMIEQFKILNTILSPIRPTSPIIPMSPTPIILPEYTYRPLQQPPVLEKILPGFIQRFMTNSPRCGLNEAGSTLYYPHTTDVAEIPTDQLEMLCEFNLTGLHIKAKVLNIIDGDTISLSFFVPMSYMNTPRKETKGRTKEIRDVRPVIAFERDAGFFVRMKVRLAEIDTAEKNTNKGKIAKKILEQRIGSLNNIVYAHFIGFEKFGRLLAHIFTDSEETNNINRELLEFQHPILGLVAVPYFGAKKQEWPATPREYKLEPEYQ